MPAVVCGSPMLWRCRVPPWWHGNTAGQSEAGQAACWRSGEYRRARRGSTAGRVCRAGAYGALRAVKLGVGAQELVGLDIGEGLRVKVGVVRVRVEELRVGLGEGLAVQRSVASVPLHDHTGRSEESLGAGQHTRTEAVGIVRRGPLRVGLGRAEGGGAQPGGRTPHR